MKTTVHSLVNKSHILQRKQPLPIPNRAPLHRCRAKPSDDDESQLQAQRQALNAMFYSTLSIDLGEDGLPEAIADTAQQEALPEMLQNLPLWRVQWATLPGDTAILNVHVPHYCHMFLQLVYGPRPWRYGHLYLPGGSQNLGNAEYCLEPGTGAPLVGTLMEISRLIQLRDGRLIVIARGVSRMRALQPTQALPYSRADCVLLPDKEETEMYKENAVCTAAEFIDGEIAMERLMAMVDRACYSAAAVAGTTWTEFECQRVDLGLGTPQVVCCTSQSDEEAAARSVVGLEAGVPFPEYTSESSRVVTHATQAAADNASHMALTKALLVLSEPGRTFEATTMQPFKFINSVQERGGPSLPPADDEDETLLEGFATAVAVDGPKALLQLEEQLWQELDALWRLAGRVANTPPPMPKAILSLRPPQLSGTRESSISEDEETQTEDVAISAAAKGAGGPEDSDIGSGDTLDGLTFLRLQRLSYMLVQLLPSVSKSEGNQAVLELPSIAERLLLLLGNLRKQRRVMAAVAALQGLKDDSDDI